MTVAEMEKAYDWFCRQAYSAASMTRAPCAPRLLIRCET